MLTKEQILTTDLHATTTIDPILEKYVTSIEYFESRLDSLDGEPKEKMLNLITELKAEMQEHKEVSEAWLEIGYLSPAILTRIHTAIGKAYNDNEDKADTDVNELMDQYRLLCRYGVKGGDKTLFDTEKFRGKDINLLSWDNIDVLEHAELLVTVASAILDYNKLSDEVKKK